jgi:hypothetical protein
LQSSSGVGINGSANIGTVQTHIVSSGVECYGQSVFNFKYNPIVVANSVAVDGLTDVQSISNVVSTALLLSNGISSSDVNYNIEVQGGLYVSGLAFKDVLTFVFGGASVSGNCVISIGSKRFKKIKVNRQSGVVIPKNHKTAIPQYVPDPQGEADIAAKIIVTSTIPVPVKNRKKVPNYSPEPQSGRVIIKKQGVA